MIWNMDNPESAAASIIANLEPDKAKQVAALLVIHFKWKNMLEVLGLKDFQEWDFGNDENDHLDL